MQTSKIIRDPSRKVKEGEEPVAAPVTVYVLFMDVVGFSRLDMPAQEAVVRALNRFVKVAKEKCWDSDKRTRHSDPRSPHSPENPLFIPTGDGMAVVFFDQQQGDEYKQALLWALEISALLTELKRSQPEHGFDLRMGLHVQEVQVIQDPNGRPNVAGPGINMAQRVMDSGDAGHILGSEAYRETVRGRDAVLGRLFSEAPFTAYIKGGDDARLYTVTQTQGADLLGKLAPIPKV